jgi:hypothetical protein
MRAKKKAASGCVAVTEFAAFGAALGRAIFAFVVAVACAFVFAAAFFPAPIFAFARTVAPIFAVALALTPTLTLATASIAAEDLPTPPIEPAIEPSKTILLTKLSNFPFYL